MEIERKFLLGSLPFSLSELDSAEIVQSYITDLGTLPECRLRKLERGGKVKFFLTEKCGSGMIRTENETEITKDEYESLRKGVKGNEISKSRYFVPLSDSLVAEVDIYHEGLSGLTVAEVEFDSAEAAISFQPPRWFSYEITDDKRYKNRALAQNGAPTEKTENK